MSDIDTIIANDIIAKIAAISIANGYINDASVLNGYMVHYANDLLDPNTVLNFPAVAVQPLNDLPNPDSTQTKSKNERVMRVIGAVSSSDPALVNQGINSLLFDVRKALAINTYDNDDTKALELNMGQANFNLPDSQDQYAFFEMDITIKYIEHWK